MRHTGSSKETSLRILLLRFLVGPTPSNVLQDYIFFARSAKMRALLEKLALCKFIPFFACASNACSARISKNARHLRCYPIKKSAFPCCPSPNVAFPYLPMPFYEMQTQKVTIRIPFFHLIEKKIFPGICAL